jgi:excisionase family DNA binding protein
MPNIPEYVSTTELAKLAHVTRMTIYRWCREGRITPVNSPNPLTARRQPIRFRREEVERFLEPLYGRAS